MMKHKVKVSAMHEDKRDIFLLKQIDLIILLLIL